jgi:hypothetical protein
MSKRKAHQAVSIVDWKADAVVKIDGCVKEESVRAIQTELHILLAGAEARIRDIKCETNDFTNGCMVKMTASNEHQDQDMGYNICSREVTAQFTAGPEGAKFSISFSNKNVEGDQTIVVESELFNLEEDSFSEVSDEEIGMFLTKAGLYGAHTCHNGKDCDAKDDAERRRWAYADVISEAIKLVEEKYGHEDSCGVELGMSSDDIFGHLDLQY